MGNNPSVRRFKADMQALANQMAQSFQRTLVLQAQELVGDIQRAIPHSESGNLRESVRYKDVSRRSGNRIEPSVLVMAGGPKTTRRAANGQVSDYALFEEFGTVKEDPRPFFYSTVRLWRAGGLAEYRETFEQAIAENNNVRAARAANYTDAGGFSYSSGYAARGGKSIRTIVV